MRYRPEIDGLRAVAVMPVILFHAGAGVFKGGYIGVDIFFVISGYLITGIIVSEVADRKFSIAKFYERRARRILPALFLVLSASLIAFPFVTMVPAQLESFGSSVISVIFFVSNIFFWTQSGYFGSVSETTPLLHTWSLAVEEQFYIFFPFLVVFVYPMGAKRMIYIVFFVFLVSLAISEWGWRNSPVGNFYLAPSRIWELMIGAMTVIFQRKGAFDKASENLSSLLALLGAFLVVISLLFFSKSTPHPGLITLVPVIGTALIIAFANPANVVGRLLGLPIPVFIGLLSYSLYLWHQPVLAFAKRLTGTDLSFTLQAVLVSLIFVASYFTWRFVETPIRKSTSINRRGVFVFSAGYSLVLAVLGMLLVHNLSIQRAIWPDDMSRYEVLRQASDSEFNKMVQDDCRLYSENFTAEFLSKFEECSIRYKKAIFITGGSHAMDLYNAFALNAPVPFIVSVSKGYCRPHDYLGVRPPVKCHYEDLRVFLSQHAHQIAKLIYTQNPMSLYHKPMDQARENDLAIDEVKQVVEYLSDLKSDFGIDIDVIGMLPPLTQSPAELDYKRPLVTQLDNIVSGNMLSMTIYLDEIFEALLDKAGIGFYSKFSLFDLALPRDIYTHSKINYSDDNHLSRAGEEYFGAVMISELSELGYFEFRKNEIEMRL